MEETQPAPALGLGGLPWQELLYLCQAGWGLLPQLAFGLLGGGGGGGAIYFSSKLLGRQFAS